MKTTLKFLTALALVLGITLATPQSLSARGRGHRGAAPRKPLVPPNHVTVSAVSDSSITVASKNGSRTYTINKFATISVYGNTAPISSVQVGMRVMVGTNSKGEATSISASAAPAPAKSTATTSKRHKGGRRR